MLSGSRAKRESLSLVVTLAITAFWKAGAPRSYPRPQASMSFRNPPEEMYLSLYSQVTKVEKVLGLVALRHSFSIWRVVAADWTSLSQVAALSSVEVPISPPLLALLKEWKLEQLRKRALWMKNVSRGVVPTAISMRSGCLSLFHPISRFWEPYSYETYRSILDTLLSVSVALDGRFALATGVLEPLVAGILESVIDGALRLAVVWLRCNVEFGRKSGLDPTPKLKCALELDSQKGIVMRRLQRW